MALLYPDTELLGQQDQVEHHQNLEQHRAVVVGSLPLVAEVDSLQAAVVGNLQAVVVDNPQVVVAGNLQAAVVDSHQLVADSHQLVVDYQDSPGQIVEDKLDSPEVH